jgi:hypothetical protein
MFRCPLWKVYLLLKMTDAFTYPVHNQEGTWPQQDHLFVHIIPLLSAMQDAIQWADYSRSFAALQYSQRREHRARGRRRRPASSLHPGCHLYDLVVWNIFELASKTPPCRDEAGLRLGPDVCPVHRSAHTFEKPKAQLVFIFAICYTAVV